jgi:hypothetical protein
MINELAEQILSRFAALEDELADPAVIGDREKFTAASKAYRDLEPGSCSRRRGSGSGRSRRRSGWRWSSGIRTTTRA